MDVEFSGVVFQWRGPAPYYYVELPDEESQDLEAESGRLTYGWGVIPVRARIGGTQWQTSLFPKDGRYLLPLKAAVRRSEQIGDGDVVDVQMTAGRDR